MTIAAFYRLMRDWHRVRGLRGNYWALRRLATQLRGLLRRSNWRFGICVARDHTRYLLGGPSPVDLPSMECAGAAADWLLQAAGASGDDGVSYGYFPVSSPSGWRPSYPETTGYIITSLLQYARVAGRPDVRDRALAMASWEVEIQMASGAVQGGPLCPPEERTPAAFNTGMVLDGLISALEEGAGEDVRTGAIAAADFLAGDIDDRGYFKTNGRFVAEHKIKLYNCLCGWALARAGRFFENEHYVARAEAVAEAALLQQSDSGYFAHNCLGHPARPLTHTIGYTLQGLLEIGVETDRKDFVEAAERGVKPLIDRVGKNGFLYGRYYSDWQPGLLSSCLTGSAQIAIVAYRLAELNGEPEYANAADRIVNFLKAVQLRSGHVPETRGAIPGSFPILGHYISGGYPNWATKYLLDALMLQEQRNRSIPATGVSNIAASVAESV